MIESAEKTELHPLEQAGLGAPPYRFHGVSEKVVPVAGYYVDGTPNSAMGYRPAGSCDYCGTGIRYCYTFKASGGEEFVMGCDCAAKGFSSDLATWQEIRQSMKDARKALFAEKREAERAADRKAREDIEREQNEAAGLGALTDHEIHMAEVQAAHEREEKARLAREATEIARRKASCHIGTVGKRYRMTLTLEFSTAFDGFYGTTYLSSFRDANGNSVVYMGSSIIPARRGETIELVAGIKDHGEYTRNDGLNVAEQQTKITRPHLAGMRILSASPASEFNRHGEPLRDVSREGTNGRHGCEPTSPKSHTKLPTL